MAERPSALNDYDVLEVLGKGTFGKVSKIRRKSTGAILVWKVSACLALFPQQAHNLTHKSHTNPHRKCDTTR
jgi:hypothetical protein